MGCNNENKNPNRSLESVRVLYYVQRINKCRMQSAEHRVKGYPVGAIHESPENKRLAVIKVGERSSPLRKTIKSKVRTSVPDGPKNERIFLRSE